MTGDNVISFPSRAREGGFEITDDIEITAALHQACMAFQDRPPNHVAWALIQVVSDFLGTIDNPTERRAECGYLMGLLMTETERAVRERQRDEV